MAFRLKSVSNQLHIDLNATPQAGNVNLKGNDILVGGNVDDVTVNGESKVVNKVAQLTVDTALNSSSENPIANSAVNSALENKQPKEDGKGLSTNDYDNTEKQKVTDAYNDKHTHSNKSTLDDITGIDSVVTSGSDNLVTSGAVYTVVGNIESLLAALR